MSSILYVFTPFETHNDMMRMAYYITVVLLVWLMSLWYSELSMFAAVVRQRCLAQIAVCLIEKTFFPAALDQNVPASSEHRLTDLWLRVYRLLLTARFVCRSN